jgi:N-acetylglucosamine-6-phosphate deacetylase
MRLKALHYQTEQPVTIDIEQGTIVRIAEAEAEWEEGLSLPYAAPGLVDLQLNGYAGNDFNRMPLTADEIGDAVR